MRTGGPASADSAHNGMECAPLPVRLTENGLTADAGKKERLQRDSQAWGTPHHGDNPPCGTGTETTRGFRYSSRYLAEPPRQASFGRGGLGTFSGGGGPPFPLQALFRVLARKRNRSAYLISYISLWEGDSFAESSKNTEKEVL